GKGLGSKFKDTGAGGNGKSNVGVSGLSKGGKGLGAGGFGDGGLGDRKAVTIIPGGDGEEFSGQIDREGIRKVFFDNQRAIRSCYERELNRNPNLGGILKLNFDIGELGRVVGRPSINWGDSSLKSRTVAGCILNRLKTWRFPEPPRNQVVNVIYPLAFQSK
ncbi:MAG: AgmX/PglI C-terminal domain-containing protein, partial [Pseudomonadota bacterium]